MRAFTYYGSVSEGICVAHRAWGHSATSLGPDTDSWVVASETKPPTYWNDLTISDASLSLEAIEGTRRWAFATPRCAADNLILVKVWSRRVTTVLGDPLVIRGDRAALVVLALGDTIEADTAGGATRVSVNSWRVPFEWGGT